MVLECLFSKIDKKKKALVWSDDYANLTRKAFSH